jgi:nucleoside-diphosphate-sugar epimerase
VQPTFVWDLVDAVESALDHPVAVGKIYTVAGPRPLTYREMILTISKQAGLRKPLFIRLPRRPMMAVARLAKAVWAKSPLNPEMIERFGEERVFNIEDARRDLEYAPISFEEGIARKVRGEA